MDEISKVIIVLCIFYPFISLHLYNIHREIKKSNEELINIRNLLIGISNKLSK